MTKNRVVELAGGETISDSLTALPGLEAQQLISQSVEVELEELPGRYSDYYPADGTVAVVGKTKSLEAALPQLYPKGIWSGEMSGTLKVLLGPQAQGLSVSPLLRLKQI